MNRRQVERWLRRRAPRTAGELIGAGVIAVVSLLWLLHGVTSAGRWLLGAWPVLAALGVTAVTAMAIWAARRMAAGRGNARRLAALRVGMGAVDAMDDRSFEFALRDLMLRDGCARARRVGQAGDQCADVIAEHPAYGRIVIQAKHTTVAAKVGSHVMYQVNGTARPVHGADVAVVVTNGFLTRDAKAWGDRYGIRWIDRALLQRWAEEGRSLGDLLHLPAVRRRVLRGGLLSDPPGVSGAASRP